MHVNIFVRKTVSEPYFYCGETQESSWLNVVDDIEEVSHFWARVVTPREDCDQAIRYCSQQKINNQHFLCSAKGPLSLKMRPCESTR